MSGWSGWGPRLILFCALGLLQASSFFAGRYSAYAMFEKFGTLPLGEWAAWFTMWVYLPLFLLTGVLLLLFPERRLPSSRWRPLIWLGLVLGVVQTVAEMVRPGPLYYSIPSGFLENPAGLESAHGFLEAVGQWPGSAAMAVFLAGAGHLSNDTAGPDSTSVSKSNGLLQ